MRKPWDGRLGFPFVIVSAFVTAGLAFLVSQVVMLIGTGGSFSFWGFAIMLSGTLAVVELVGVLLGGWLVVACFGGRPGRRSVRALWAGAVCGLAAGASVLLGAALVGVGGAWVLVITSTVGAGLVSGLSAAVVRPAPLVSELPIADVP
ncbi:hypothetical protein [Cnuibacter physcomitrellae]|uniref:hypothetical protein n=1 Tax=Cnuibacter physcomitrellae TaxID=1619308 RepID=UPI001C2CADC3|nr:hypothetical protein [Cnuibacter physcomitrellae]